jgi:hypothetical protein
MAVEVSAQHTRTRLERTGEPFEGALEAEGKSTSATKGRRLPREEGCERTQEWWEGYDPGMDAGF